MATILPTTTEFDIEQPRGKESDETNVPDRPVLLKVGSDMFYSNPWLQRWLGCDFPLLPEEAMEAYHKHHLYSVNPFIFIPVLALFFLLLVFRSGMIVGLNQIRDDSMNLSIVLVIAVICMVAHSIFFCLYLILHALRLTGRDVMLADLTSRLKYFCFFRLEESIFFLAICSWSLFLVARVLKGQCPPGTSLWEQQACNQFASQGGIPTELAYGLYMIPLALQMTMKNISVRTLVIGHLSTLTAVLFCICYQQAWSDYFVVLNWILSSNVSFECKRQHRVAYKKLMKAREQQELALLISKQVEMLRLEQERILQEKAIHELAEEAKRSSEALKTKCALVRHIGHEIRTPLNVVGVGVDLLIKDLAPHAAVLPDGVMDIIYGIQEASTASLEVINELLMFEKLAAGMTTLECVRTPVLPFLEQAMKQHLLPARAKEISFALIPLSAASSHVVINVDPLKLATVFRNLFSNAIKFTKKYGRVTVRVEVKTIDDIEVVEVTVQDSGAGLSAENLGRLFGEGVQFNANGLQGGGGSGLGLFITKGIVELHKHGKIWAESQGEGFGCTFFVHLPLHSHHYVSPSGSNNSLLALLNPSPSSSDESTRTFTNDFTRRQSVLADNMSTSSSERGSNGGTPSERGKERRFNVLALAQPKLAAVNAWKPTILVVDDSKMNRKMLVRMLISKGFACREAEDGVEALSEMSRMNFQSLYSFNPFSGMLSHQTPRTLLQESVPYPYQMQSDEQSLEKPLQQFAIDAVLIDFNMPRMNGPDTIMEMRKIGFRGPIIGVSGGEEETMKQFLQAGADEVLQKPAKTDQLVGMLLRGFEMVVREETRGQDDNSSTKTRNNSTENSQGGSDDGTDIKSRRGSDRDDGMNHQARGESDDGTDNKSRRGSDDGTHNKSPGESDDGSNNKSPGESDDSSNNKSPGESDDGMNHQAPISENETARQEHLAHLRRFVVESLAATAKT